MIYFHRTFLGLLFILTIFLVSQIDYSTPLHETLNNQFTLVSWLFAGIMSLIGFVTLLIAFLLDNNLNVSANTLHRIHYPFQSTSIDDLISNIVIYREKTKNIIIISPIYYTFVAASLSIIFSIGVLVGQYTKFKISFKMDLKVESAVVLGIYSLYLVIAIALILLSYFILNVKALKNPHNKGFLPHAEELIDSNYLLENCDSNFFRFLVPEVYFHKDTQINGEDVYQCNVTSRLPINGFKFVIKIYRNREETFKIVGWHKDTLNVNNIGKALSESYNISKQSYDKIDQNYGFIKIYDAENRLQHKYKLRVQKIDDYHIIDVLSQVPNDNKDLDEAHFISNNNDTHGASYSIKYN